MKNFYRYFERTITNGSTALLSVYGRFLTLLNNTSSTDILISISNQQYEQLPQGLSVELPPENVFTEIKFQNTSGATITIKFCISNGRVYDNRVVISGDLSVTDISDGISTPAKVDVATGSAQSLIAVNTNRKEIIIQNTGDFDLWIGDANIDPPTNRGIHLVSNDSITLATTAQIYGEAVTGATIASLLELTKS